MKILLFGATGMIGQGVLRECLADPEVTQVVSLARANTGQTHAKLREVAHKDFSNFKPVEDEFKEIDACFFCLGVSASGMTEADYRHVTFDYTTAAAEMLLAQSPKATFIYVSGAGTDSSEKGRWMWARVKGFTENTLLKLPFPRNFMFRPGYIQPVHGTQSKTALYRFAYGLLGPLYPLWKRLFPRHMLTTEDLGRAMLQAAKHGAEPAVLESWHLAELSKAYSR